MIYTEEDLEQAYAIGYNEAVDDVNEYAEQESMEFSLDDDYSAVEDMIYNETKTENKKKRDEYIKRMEPLDDRAELDPDSKAFNDKSARN